jgi:hypothetical protein
MKREMGAAAGLRERLSYMLIGSKRLQTVLLPSESRLVNRLTQRLQERSQFNSGPLQQFFDNIVVDTSVKPMY